MIGITGNIACGKTLVLDTLRSLGAETIDADRVAHEEMRTGTESWHRIVAHFGTGILQEDDEIDRRRLGEIVFRDAAQLQRLEQILHPAVVDHIRRRIAESAAKVVALDAIKLFESGLDADCDEVWVVRCDREQQIERLMQRNGFSREEALRRINAQPPQDEKVRRADRVIDNSGTIEATRRAVEIAFEAITR